MMMTEMVLAGLLGMSCLVLLVLWLKGRSDLLLCRKERDFFKDQVATLSHSKDDLHKTLETLCHQALVGTQQHFLSSLAPVLSRLQDQTTHHFQTQTASLQHLTSPLAKALEDMRQNLQQLEQHRAGAYEGLKEQVKHLMEGQQKLSLETNNLATALRTPHVRGCWGEMQLRRAVEIAGMAMHCDFQEQVTLTKDEQKVRPDLIVHLSDDKCVIVDAKAPVLYYLEAMSATSTPLYEEKLAEHARTLLMHIQRLSDKSYWMYEGKSPEFVVLFLPGEAFLSAALQTQPDLIEVAAQKGLILATPIILIALLKTIALGWRQKHLSQHAESIVALGQRLFVAVKDFQQHFEDIGKGVKQLEGHYAKGEKALEKTLAPLVKSLGETGVAFGVKAGKKKRLS